MKKQDDFGIGASISVTLLFLGMALMSLQTEASGMLIFFPFLGVFVGVIMIIMKFIQKENEETKNELQKKAEKFIEHDSSCGDSKMKLYFDSKKNKVTICATTTDGTKQEEIDNFVRSNVVITDNHIVAVDFVNLKILKVVSSQNGEIIKVLYELHDDLKTLGIILNKSEPTLKAYNDYAFITDDINEYVVIVTPAKNHVYRYSDIVKISYHENGADVFNRSLGGAVVGGLLFGGVGAIVGSNTAKSTQNKEIETMSIKILLNKTSNPTLNMTIYNGPVLNTKYASDRMHYEGLMKEVSGIKDIFSIIIDIVDRRNASTSSTVISSQTPVSVADELEKLVKLKDSGILTEEEFNDQKTKILNKG